MAEVKDPRIKLFGKTIGGTIEMAAAVAAESGAASGEGSPNQDPPSSANSGHEDDDLSTKTEDPELHKDRSCPKQDDATEEDGTHPSILTQVEESNPPQSVVDASNTATADNIAGTEQTRKAKKEYQSVTSNSKEKILKKPDKILPCPRCNSMDTKFCYFNNYNVNQPRHFCKNCQRYWTAGGTTRNVPVGAGRRRNKNTATTSQFHQQPVPEVPRADFPSTICTNGSGLAFTSDTPLCESMVSVLNIDSESCGNKENRLHNVGKSPIPNASSEEKLGNNEMREGIPTSLHYFPGAPWLYAWNSVPGTVAVSPPSFGPPGYPFPFYSIAPPYWGCAVPGAWNVPWISPPTSGPKSGPNSPTLGKHSRDDNALHSRDEDGTQKESDPEKCLWVPKTLRIYDPGEAAKSSIWTILDIVKKDKIESIGGSSLFKAFQSRSMGDDEKAEVEVPDASAALQANPAALSRSQSFHESL